VDDETAMIAEAVGRIFADLADPQTVNAARDAAWRAPLWAARLRAISSRPRNCRWPGMFSL